MNALVKIIRDDDGILIDDPQWHLVDPCYPGVYGAALCTGEVFGPGESAVEFELKVVKRGIPCALCQEVVRAYKDVKL